VTVPFLELRSSTLELREELEEASRRVLRSGSYVLGPEVEAFEHEFAAYCGSAHCVGVANGLEALALILIAAGVGPGAEVLVPSNTYIATWLAVSWVGARPVPVEPREDTHNIDPHLIEAAITPRTRAIIPVHLYGQPVDWAPLKAVADRHELMVVEDAAHAHGATYRSRRCGALGHAAAFSFYPTKNLGAYGDAGAVTTDDEQLAERLRLLRNYGSPSKYENAVKGWNSRLDELQAALLRVRLRHLDAWNTRRADHATHYHERLAHVDDPDLILPRVAPGTEPVWHQFVIRHPRRDALASTLAERGIGTLIHYPIPPHRSEAYAELASELGPLPIAERLAAEVLSLPIGPELSEQAVITAADAVAEVCRTLGGTTA
jgi:dTDP-4-amino-4,6-dideoxygalactose transaminase